MIYTSLELTIFLIAAAGVAVGISISLTTRNKKLKTVANIRIQEGGNQISQDQRTFAGDSLADSQVYKVMSTPKSPVEESREYIESVSFVTPPAESVNTFQTHEAETPTTSPFSPEVVTLEDASTSQESNRISVSESKASENEEKTIAESNTAVFPKVDDSISTPPTSTQDSSLTSATPALAVPTDSIALQNVSAAPFPIRAQAVLSDTSNLVGTSGNFTTGPSAYCVKCKSKREIRDPKAVTMKNGRAAISGFCHDCGTRVFRIGRYPVS